MARFFSTEEQGGFAGNLAYAVIAQGVGLLSSFITSLVLPKFLSVENYAYWQLFLLYSSYSGFALLGINDGIYLRLGGEQYSELNHGELKAQQCIVLVSQVFVAVCCLTAIAVAESWSYRGLVLALCVVFGLLANLTQCLRYVFQCTNLTRISSLADFFSKGLFVLLMAMILLLGMDSSLPIIVGFIACQAVALIYVLICARETLHAKASFPGVLGMTLSDIRAGLKIMVAYYADSLVVGFTRMLAERYLGLAVFGILSLSFSLTNFVLGFIGQVSMVVFPVLRRLDADGQKEKYLEIRSILHTVLPCSYLLYVPVKVMLGFWLPEYGESLAYLALTMPLCIYSCKASLLFNTYLKMRRKEGLLCAVNVATMVLNGALAIACIVGLSSVELATCSIVLSVMLRDLSFELIMARRFENTVAHFCLTELLLTAGFMAASWYLDVWSWPVVALMLVGYLWYDKDGVNLFISEVKRRLVRRQ